MSSVSDAGHGPIVSFVTSDRAARWTSRVLLVVVWQLAAGLSDHVATPIETVQFLVDEFHRSYRGEPLTILNNELVRNLAISLQRAGTALALVVVIGLRSATRWAGGGGPRRS